MVKPVAVAALLVLTSALLSGCTLLEGEGAERGTLVRIVDLSFDPEAFEQEPNDAADVFSMVAQTRFEYTHAAGEMATGDVTVSYVDEEGRSRDTPLSDFTSAATVAKGDRVTLGGILLTSPVTLANGDAVLAKRGGPAREWLEVGGYPLPIHAAPGANAVWSLRGDAEATASLDRFASEERWTSYEPEYVCHPHPLPTMPPTCGYETNETEVVETYELTGLSASAGGDLDGRMHIAGIGAGGSGLDLELGLDGTLGLHALWSAHIVSTSSQDPDSNVDADFGMDARLDADGDGSIVLGFRGGELRSIGGKGALDVTGDVTLWDDEHPRSEGYSPGDLDDLSMSTPYEEEPVDIDADPVAFVAEALADLWRMDFLPGDEIRLQEDGGHGMPSVAYTVRAVDLVEKEVPAGTFDTVRLVTSTVLTVPVDGEAPETLELPATTTWIDRESGVPVATAQTASYDLDQEDVEGLLALAREMAEDGESEVTFPEQLSAQLVGGSSIELVQWDEGLRMAPAASVLSPLWGFVGGFLLGTGMPFMPYGGLDHDEAAWAPDVAFSTDETRDRITIVMAEPGLSSWEFEYKATQPTVYGYNSQAVAGGPTIGTTYAPADAAPWEFSAGDFLDFCDGDGELAGPTTFQVRHAPSNTVVYETTLQGIDAC